MSFNRTSLTLSVHLSIGGEYLFSSVRRQRFLNNKNNRVWISFCSAKIVPSGIFPTDPCLHSSHVSTSICACVKAVSGQWRGGAGSGSDRSGWLWVADLWGHVIRLPPLELLPNQPLHLFPVGVCVSSQPLILTNSNRWNQRVRDDIFIWFLLHWISSWLIKTPTSCLPLWLHPAACPARLSSSV